VNHHRVDRTIDSIIGTAEHIGIKLPAAKAELLYRLHTIDGYPTGTYAPKVTATTELTTVEVAADQRIHLEADLRWLDDELNAAVLVLANLARECDRIIGMRLQGPGRCSAVGRQGAIEWGDANCWNAPDRGPLCARCYQRERRWRQHNGLPTREVA
jgi:hypothetical protein